MSSASFSWSLRRDGNSGFVLESRPDGSTQEFGPMPAHVTPAFAMGRRRLVAMMMERSGHTYHAETLSDADLQQFTH